MNEENADSYQIHSNMAQPEIETSQLHVHKTFGEPESEDVTGESSE